jgi:hypothetical protein
MMAKKNGSSGSAPKKSSAREVTPSVTADRWVGVTEHWSEVPQEHDYPAAASYLALVCEPTEARRLVAALKQAPSVRHQAKDLLRASGLACLPLDNVHVARDLAKINRGEALSPVLLVRGDFRRGVPLTIADGYHRICASYHVNEDADIPCLLVDHKVSTATPGFRLGAAASEETGQRATASPGALSAPGVTGSREGASSEGTSSRPLA